MRIAYFAHFNGGNRSGVFHKVGAQIDAWRGRRHAVRLFLATRDQPQPWVERMGDSRVRQYAGPASRLRAMSALIRDLRCFDPDVVYLRWDLFYPQMMFFPRRTPLVIELNSDDINEYRMGSRVRSIYNSGTRSLLLGRASALVFVTSELGKGPSFRRFRGRHVVIPNGVDLQAYPILAAPSNPRPRLVFVGTPGQSWHGTDKVLRLAHLRQDWHFDIVGPTNEMSDALANVDWHGQLNRAEVLEILARADVGIGTLGLHRKSMEEACPLKVREYLAVGLPVIYGYSDPDLDGIEPTLRIPNTESSIETDIGRIDAFVNESRGSRISRSSIVHLDVAVKEEQRLALFDDLVNQ
jgi:glycosyltransferase involved in cell wall biosynthesis